MTNLEDLIALQVDNGNELLKTHQLSCPGNATYLSKASIAELLKSISYCIEKELLEKLDSSIFFSLLCDESTDVASKEELSICARWLENGSAVEHFLGIVHAKAVTAEAITEYILRFFQEKNSQSRNYVD